MHKNTGIGLLFLSLILCSMALVPAVKGNYQVEVGEIYQYDVLKARVNSTINGNFEQGFGYTIDQNHLEEDTTITYEITDKNSSGVFWNLSSGGYLTQDVSEQTDIRERMDLTMLSFSLPYLYGKDPNDVANGSGLMLYSPFADFSATSDHLTHLRTPEDHVQTYIDSQEDAKIKRELATHSTETNDILSIEFIFGGTIEGKWRFISVDATFSNHLIYDYNKSNGVLLGLKIKASYNGVYDTNNISRSVLFHIEYIEHDLAEFALKDPSVRAGNVGIGLLTFGIVATIVLIKRRKTRK